VKSMDAEIRDVAKGKRENRRRYSGDYTLR
jgi:hypothetical protein